MKKQISFIFIIIFILFASIGVAVFIAAINFSLNDYNYRTKYLFILSQKLKTEAYKNLENGYNEEFTLEKKFGEFCYRFLGNELTENKIKLTNDQTIRGIIYANGDIYKGKIDPLTLNLDAEKLNLKWKWYNWLGFDIDHANQPSI